MLGPQVSTKESMELEIEIEVAARRDQEDILALILDQLAKHSIRVDHEELAKSIDKVLANNELGIFLVARKAKGIVGLAYISFIWSLEHCGLSAWLDELYVVPDQRNLGIGRALLTEVARRAQEQGCSAIDLEVDQNLSRAENLYRRDGFKRLFRTRWVRVLGEDGA